MHAIIIYQILFKHCSLKDLKEFENDSTWSCKVPDWESKDTELNCVVELLDAFPNSSSAPKVNSQLHNLVEQMIKRAYRPGMKRDRVAFENDFAEWTLLLITGVTESASM